MLSLKISTLKYYMKESRLRHLFKFWRALMCQKHYDCVTIFIYIYIFFYINTNQIKII